MRDERSRHADEKRRHGERRELVAEQVDPGSFCGDVLVADREKGTSYPRTKEIGRKERRPARREHREPIKTKITGFLPSSLVEGTERPSLRGSTAAARSTIVWASPELSRPLFSPRARGEARFRRCRQQPRHRLDRAGGRSRRRSSAFVRCSRPIPVLPKDTTTWASRSCRKESLKRAWFTSVALSSSNRASRRRTIISACCSMNRPSPIVSLLTNPRRDFGLAPSQTRSRLLAWKVFEEVAVYFK